MVEINIRSDIKALSRDLDRLARLQIPFATATTINEVARKVSEAETQSMATVYDTPTPFTLKAMGVIPARKDSPTATVFIKDRQAAYLGPSILRGRQYLGGKRAILTPRDIQLNAYGNIAKGKLAQLKGRPDIFVGQVKTKTGKTISGVWQRPTQAGSGVGKRIRGIKRNSSGHLRLLIQFTNPAELTHIFPFEAVARRTVAATLPAAWERNLAAALASAR